MSPTALLMTLAVLSASPREWNGPVAAGEQRQLFLDDTIIASMDNGKIDHDIYSLAALAAGNFGAVSAMAKIIGEGEFSLLFHKGKKENIHFNKIMSEFLLITIFGTDMSLGFLRLKVDEAVGKITKALENIQTP